MNTIKTELKDSKHNLEFKITSIEKSKAHGKLMVDGKVADGFFEWTEKSGLGWSFDGVFNDVNDDIDMTVDDNEALIGFQTKIVNAIQEA